ncbi:hypothetical protein [Thermoanaerobacterium thermosaccharolyticum]|uniref:Uncharacterized protein n=1 Tax=Thermoanaerobacterium thermosaccharolyticum (strain ATCC 7956 / DSM 571 / NCIMB 9385 / NCA 3814 / NCTC 13789 / WDCM 00135 / 2032) TaxID=580327 RepID=D9TNW5_THETC|nr:hypothetical protein [Thermoanaerobacterium thermosaccharolyticum]ADL69523.1 hypothetical protein Tthe_2041 [Thermoanaerobacterium thermosaccharolyticum DSM 571]KAA5808054.1 hypothetical protein F1655_02740 [Thermoanaerobacterium thermosaccharolyticum]TCW34770.1 hypothetical protein EDC21_1163 [Thermohydrogenium kirishiense]
MLLIILIFVIAITYLIVSSKHPQFKMKKIRYTVTLFLCMLLAIHFYLDYFRIGSFNSLILNNFDNSKVVSVMLVKNTDNTKDSIIKSTSDAKTINDLIAYLKQFKLLQYNGKYSSSNNHSYDIVFYTDKKDEKIGISVTNENYIDVAVTTTKTYHLFFFNWYNNINSYKSYKIVNGKINSHFLDSVLDSIED